MALLLMAPRLYLAMSADGLFPRALASRHPATGAPARATAVLACLATVFVFSGDFSQIVAFFLCPTLAFIALAAAGLFVLRRRERETSAFRCPGYPLSTALFVVFLAAVVLLAALARPVAALAGFVIVGLGLPAFRLFAPPAEPGPAIQEGDSR
jgi:APA family basic amino acid/polyamine antiporter